VRSQLHHSSWEERAPAVIFVMTRAPRDVKLGEHSEPLLCKARAPPAKNVKQYNMVDCHRGVATIASGGRNQVPGFQGNPNAGSNH
jgi:hypothetical protein